MHGVLWVGAGEHGVPRVGAGISAAAPSPISSPPGGTAAPGILPRKKRPGAASFPTLPSSCRDR